MGRKRTYAPLDVYMNRRKVGQYFREPDGAFAFAYAAEWLAWENAMPISRSLPLRPERYVGPRVIAVFENLLPDSGDIRRRVAERVGADGLDAYGQWTLPTGTTPTTHILKPAIGTLPNGMDLTDSIENEHFCLRLMAAFGLKVAPTEIVRFAGIKALVVERFDRLRARDDRLIRLPQEELPLHASRIKADRPSRNPWRRYRGYGPLGAAAFSAHQMFIPRNAASPLERLFQGMPPCGTMGNPVAAKGRGCVKTRLYDMAQNEIPL